MKICMNLVNVCLVHKDHTVCVSCIVTVFVLDDFVPWLVNGVSTYAVWF